MFACGEKDMNGSGFNRALCEQAMILYSTVNIDLDTMVVKADNTHKNMKVFLKKVPICILIV